MNMGAFDAYLTRKRIKNMNLRIDSEGNVNVSAPIHYSLALIQAFLHEKEAWIVAHRNRILIRSNITNPVLHSGEQHFFLGQAYALVFNETTEKQRIILDENRICCYVKADATDEFK